MPKSYHQFCGVALALDILGERWTLLIVRDLLLGPRRYSDLLSGLPGITTNLLAARLKRLEEAGLIERRKLATPTPGWVYALTSQGKTLEPVVLALGAFGAQYMNAPPGPDVRTNVRWAMVSLKRRFTGSKNRWSLELEIGGQVFHAVIDSATIEIADGPANAAVDLRVKGPPRAFAAMLFGAATARELVRSGALVREGPAGALADFARSIGARP